MQSSIDGGTSWQNVGAFGDPNNWYTDNTIFGGPGGQQEGWSGRASTNNGSGGWVEARHALDNLGGQAAVQLRIAFGTDGSVTDDGFAFDNILIYEIPDEDMGVVSITNPSGGFCTGDTIPVSVVIENFGVATQGGIPINVDITGPITQTLTVVSPDSVAPGDIDSVLIGTIPANIPGDYTFTAYTVLNGDTTLFNDSTLGVNLITVTQTAVAPTVIGDSICATDSAQFTLIAQSAADNHFWYDSVGGSVIFVGDTFNTPFLSNTTTYYVEATNGLVAQAFTPVDNTIGTGGNYTFFADGLEFDVISDFTLNSVKVYPNAAGLIVANLLDANGTTLQTTSVPFGGTVTDTVITLNWDIAPGVDYQINAVGTTTGGLFRNTGGASYPYTAPGIVSITNAINNLAGFYYFFYDWQITAAGCPSPLVPVTAAFQAPVSVDLGADGTVCSGFPLDAFDPSIVSYVWNGDPAINTPSITADTTGIYFVDVVNNEGCTGTDSIILIVNPIPVVDLGPDTTGCDSVILDAFNAGAVYSWVGPNNITGVDQTLNANESGTYTVTVTALGCPNTDTVDVTINPSPAVDLGPDRGTCDPVTLDAGPDGSAGYLWSTTEITQTIIVPAPVGGNDTISVTVTTTEGCVTTDEVVLEPGIDPVFDLGGPIENCDSAIIDGPVIDGAPMTGQPVKLPHRLLQLVLVLSL